MKLAAQRLPGAPLGRPFKGLALECPRNVRGGFASIQLRERRRRRAPLKTGGHSGVAFAAETGAIGLMRTTMTALVMMPPIKLLATIMMSRMIKSMMKRARLCKAAPMRADASRDKRAWAASDERGCSRIERIAQMRRARARQVARKSEQSRDCHKILFVYLSPR